MNTNTQSPMFGTYTGLVAPEMARLLQMTNEVVMKIKQQTQEMYQ